MACYVIQMKVHHWENKWTTLEACRFDTLEKAKAFFDELPIKVDHRIAEAYTVTRYKPVKEV